MLCLRELQLEFFHFRTIGLMNRLVEPGMVEGLFRASARAVLERAYSEAEASLEAFQEILDTPVERVPAHPAPIERIDTLADFRQLRATAARVAFGYRLGDYRFDRYQQERSARLSSSKLVTRGAGRSAWRMRSSAASSAR